MASSSTPPLFGTKHLVQVPPSGTALSWAPTNGTVCRFAQRAISLAAANNVETLHAKFPGDGMWFCDTAPGMEAKILGGAGWVGRAPLGAEKHSVAPGFGDDFEVG